MDIDDEPAYLQPDFDPTTLKVAELRGLLVEHDVDYPSTAKKPQLVHLFNDHIAPRVAALAEQRNQVRASSRGIVSVDKTGNAVADGRKQTPGRRSAGRQTVALDDMQDTITPVKRTARTASPSKRAPGRPTRASDEEIGGQEVPATSRKLRKSSYRPAAPETPKQAEEVDDDGETSPFSTENPFQRGTPAKSPPKEHRRKVCYTAPPSLSYITLIQKKLNQIDTSAANNRWPSNISIFSTTNGLSTSPRLRVFSL